MKIAIHESKTSEKVVKTIGAEQEDGLFYQLLEFTNKAYAKKIIQAAKNGQMWGIYFTKSGRIKATFR
jgi:hypothetical protein